MQETRYKLIYQLSLVSEPVLTEARLVAGLV